MPVSLIVVVGFTVGYVNLYTIAIILFKRPVTVNESVVLNL